MKLKLSITQKVKAVMALLVVFILVFATNMMDKNHFSIVQDAYTSVYEDRLVVKGYLYNLSRQVTKKKENLYFDRAKSLGEQNDRINDSIRTLIEKYATTKLTSREDYHFESLQQQFDKLWEMENTIKSQLASSTDNLALDELMVQYNLIFDDLDALSSIQIKEGERLINNSNRIINSNDILSRLEMGFLIAIGLVMQFLIIYKPPRYRS
ncbi:MCP four helix bundle domain-containing protein [Flammeovirgaceae bacterium SG7u.111]|nr:MCP four helix bundle domain-containing protein [Flammeovirgaceae bacterium SG7u.132]WPO38204.1 MCP four helix bundle domain-containing protein [Flammeovirgaceae bacterium SG7u.111]